MLRCAAKGGEVAVRLVHSPFSVELLGEGPHGSTSSPVAVLNGRGRLMFESFKQQLASGTGEPVKPAIGLGLGLRLGLGLGLGLGSGTGEPVKRANPNPDPDAYPGPHPHPNPNPDLNPDRDPNR